MRETHCEASTSEANPGGTSLCPVFLSPQMVQTASGIVCALDAMCAGCFHPTRLDHPVDRGNTLMVCSKAPAHVLWI
jgi:hypothetical protein